MFFFATYDYLTNNQFFYIQNIFFNRKKVISIVILNLICSDLIHIIAFYRTFFGLKNLVGTQDNGN